MTTLNEISSFISTQKNEFKTKYMVNEIGIFGSYAKNRQSETSDLDVLVEFNDGDETFDNYMDLKILLEDSLKLKVDLVVKSSLREEIKNDILSEVVYA